ncbi:hypothetical protein F511_35277 [Dorcoceras hygrometricum]|uniref:Uncharacterized protein n=1 Tax=Dorcoceras hygrometricum TaxID=472368 RepID=A0A2Z7AD44_9LAMI|nr:hypothetical protein F511_35277 [Dorcoceras hygrometricum]
MGIDQLKFLSFQPTYLKNLQRPTKTEVAQTKGKKTRCKESADHHREVVFSHDDSAGHHNINVGPFRHDDSTGRSQRAKEFRSQENQITQDAAPTSCSNMLLTSFSKAQTGNAYKPKSRSSNRSEELSTRILGKMLEPETTLRSLNKLIQRSKYPKIGGESPHSPDLEIGQRRLTPPYWTLVTSYPGFSAGRGGDSAGGAPIGG